MTVCKCPTCNETLTAPPVRTEPRLRHGETPSKRGNARVGSPFQLIKHIGTGG